MTENSNSTTTQIGLRVTDEERAMIEDEASREHLTMAGLVRSIVLKELSRRREARSRSSLSTVA